MMLESNPRHRAVSLVESVTPSMGSTGHPSTKKMVTGRLLITGNDSEVVGRTVLYISHQGWVVGVAREPYQAGDCDRCSP